jgi:hypothetical protein
MISRKLQASGLALAAALALSASATTSAHAQESGFTAAEYPATLTATGAHEFNVAGRIISCGTHLQAEPIMTASEEITVEPTYSNCDFSQSPMTVPVTIATNGCIYHFAVDDHLEAETFNGRAELTCPPETGIEIDFTLMASTCTFLIAPQVLTEGGEPGGIHLENHTPSTTTLAISSVLQWTKISGGIVCGAETLTWAYQGTSSFSYTNQEGAPLTGHVGTLE